MSKGKFPSEKAILIGGAALAIWMYARSKKSSSDELPQGSLGGEDDLGANQGFDIDPNSIPQQPNQLISPIYQITPDGVVQPAQPVPVDNLTGGMSYAPPSSTPKGNTFDPYALVLGAAGFSGSYFTGIGTTFGKNVAKYGDESLSFWKRAYKEGVEAIPFAGQTATKLVSEEIVETGAKGIVKRATKVGISLVPVAGTVAGAEFDVRFSGKPRPLAYTANIFGDVLGGAGSVFGSAFSPAGTVAGAVGGQILGEQIVYQGAEYAQDYANFATQSVKSTVSRVTNAVTGNSSKSSSRSSSNSSSNQSVIASSSSSRSSSGSSSSRNVNVSSNVSSANMSVAPSSSRSSSSAPRTSVGTVLSTASRGVSTAVSSVRTAVQSTISRITSRFKRKK